MLTSRGTFLRPEEYAGPGPLWSLGREGAVAAEVLRGERHRRSQRRTLRGLAWARVGRVVVNEPVLLVPGFMAGDWSLVRLAEHLRGEGWRTYRSAIRVNAGCTMSTAEALERRLEQIAERRQAKVSIVGHSLGGMLGRGLAARRPDLVAGLVTMGSPVLAPGAVNQLLGLNAAALTGLHRLGLRSVMGADCVSGDCARESWERSHAPLDPAIGFTAIWSRRDGVVDWRSCLDPAAEHVEARCSHLGMAVDPLVRDQVAHALAEQRLTRAAHAGAEREPDARLSPASPPAGRPVEAGLRHAASR
ncbi:hypothetical protein GCM10011519_30260 [Marmoricola endophyticus]|uniref:AB hydrolase-1 domain-containing protein n=1 Tax=Marmoricola endophyticus TaxID=2040280 RepID=A0A917BR10_9ACTN|nr:alpha/beta hydrolase [Marmoricola endophyticus]GGF54303.1 hypothetical protein GCM10011519_30260 [Marmoricola endophyticus]